MTTEEKVIARIRERREMGKKKYGCTMERDDLDLVEGLEHALEEALDLPIYLQRAITKALAQGDLDHVEWLEHALEDTLDLPIYLQRAITKIKEIEAEEAIETALSIVAQDYEREADK